jgi:hypothetical protein
MKRRLAILFAVALFVGAQPAAAPADTGWGAGPCSCGD